MIIKDVSTTGMGVQVLTQSIMAQRPSRYKLAVVPGERDWGRFRSMGKQIAQLEPIVAEAVSKGFELLQVDQRLYHNGVDLVMERQFSWRLVTNVELDRIHRVTAQW